MSALSIAVFDNSSPRVFREDIGPLVSRLRLTTLIPGGCGLLTADLPAEGFVPPDYIGFGYKVEASDGQGIFWSGRMGMPELVFGTGGLVWHIVAKWWGVAMHDRIDTNRNVQNDEVSTQVSDIISTLVPAIDTIEVTATGFTFTNTAAINLERMNAADQIMWLAKFANTTYDPQQLTVYPNSRGDIVFKFAPVSTTADIICSLSDFESGSFGGNDDGLANRVTIQYNGGASYATVNDVDLQAAGAVGWNLIKEFVVVLSEISNSTDATQAANAILTARKSLRLAANGQFVAKSASRFLDAYGNAIQPHRVRAGMLVQLRDVQPYRQSLSNLAFLNSFRIAETDWSEDDQSLLLVPESFDAYLERSIAQVYALLSGFHTIPGV